MQETRTRGKNTLILAAYVGPDAVGHSLLILRDGHGKTLWKQDLGWKYRFDESDKSPAHIAVKTLLPSGQTRFQLFDVLCGAKINDYQVVDLTGVQPLLTPAPLDRHGRK